MVITSSGFGFEIEVTAKIAKLKCASRSAHQLLRPHLREGKKIGLSDGLAGVWFVVRFNLFCGLEASFRSRTAPRGAEQVCAPDPARNSESLM